MIINKPPMGWNSWNTFGDQINEKVICDMADKIVELGLKDAGYEILSAEKTKQASTSVTLETEEDIKFMSLLIEKLEDDDDVMDVYHNWENCD